MFNKGINFCPILMIMIMPFQITFADPFGIKIGQDIIEMKYDTSDFENGYVEAYADINGDTQTVATIFVKPSSIPEPCEGISKYEINLDAQRRPYQIYATAVYNKDNYNCNEAIGKYMKYLKHKYPAAKYDNNPTNIRTQYDPENNRTVDLYCFPKEYKVIMKYIDHNLYVEQKTSEAGLKIDPENRGLIEAIKAFQNRYR